MQTNFFKRFFLVSMMLVLYAAPVFAEARITSWDDLRAGGDIEFDDPIAELSPEQLRDLRIIVRIRWLIANHKSEPDGVSAREEQRLVKHLADQGVDIQWLLSQREKVAAMRRQKIETAGADIIGNHIRIPGYMLPLDTEQQGVTRFLLVPWLAPCAHFPPPPANQVIQVTISGDIASRGRFDPIWVEGILHRKPAVYSPFLVDGTSSIEAVYTLDGDSVWDYSATESDILANATTPAPDPAQSWYRNMQVRVTILFTQAMTAIRDRHSSGPVWFGLLLALAYGALHTLGPGHGKAVVISYFVGHGGSLGRGIRMGTLIAVCHVLSAVIVVGLTSFAIRQATGHAPADFRIVRLISYGAIGGIGAFMLWRALQDMRPQKQPVGPCSIAEHVHDYAGHHHGCCACSSISEHNDTPMGWLALAAGVIPCTGAILVLLFGLSHNLLIPAVLMVMAMSLGMAVSMSGIGILAIFGRNYTDRKLIQSDTARIRFHRTIRIAAAALIVVIGISLFSLTMVEAGRPTSTPTIRDTL